MAKLESKTSPFFSYMGNKLQLAHWIIPELMSCPHKTYVEVFGGTFAIGLNKPKSAIEIYNDYNKHLSRLFHVVRTRWEEFESAWNNMIISEDWHRNIFYDNHSSDDEIEDAIRYFYIMSMTYLGKYTGGFSYQAKESFTNIIENKLHVAKIIHNRIKNVIILNKHAFKVIEQNNTKDTLLYLDPPYVSTEVYYERLAGSFNRQDHVELRDLLLKHKGYWFLSYEDDEMVNDLYRNFRFIRQKQNRSSNNTTVNEVLVTNYTKEIFNGKLF